MVETLVVETLSKLKSGWIGESDLDTPISMTIVSKMISMKPRVDTIVPNIDDGPQRLGFFNAGTW
eukprot:scaffold10203_cov272-Chaetoceros_neogracile.AAC.10